MNTFKNDVLRTSVPVLRLIGGLGLLSVAGFATPVLTASPVLAKFSLNVRVDEAPPTPRHEEIIESEQPGPDYVWTEGYWDGAPGHYTWVAGRWGRPPHVYSKWMAPHWDKDRDGHYHQIKGEWRDGR
jgi:hypothetical protein